jgi:hypothetical protein
VRMSIHPTMTDEEIDYILDSLEQLCQNHVSWAKDYIYDPQTNEFRHHSAPETEQALVDDWYAWDMA